MNLIKIYFVISLRHYCSIKKQILRNSVARYDSLIMLSKNSTTETNIFAKREFPVSV